MTQTSNKRKSPFMSVVTWIYIPLILLLLYMWFHYEGGEPVKAEWYEVKEKMISEGDVEKIAYVMNEQKGTVTIKKDRLKKYENKFGGKELKYQNLYYFQLPALYDVEKEFSALRDSLPENKKFEYTLDNATDY